MRKGAVRLKRHYRHNSRLIKNPIDLSTVNPLNVSQQDEKDKEKERERERKGKRGKRGKGGKLHRGK